MEIGIGVNRRQCLSPSSVTRESQIKTRWDPSSSIALTVVGNSTFMPAIWHFQQRCSIERGVALTESSPDNCSSSTEVGMIAATSSVTSTSSIMEATGQWVLNCEPIGNAGLAVVILELLNALT